MHSKRFPEKQNQNSSGLLKISLACVIALVIFTILQVLGSNALPPALAQGPINPTPTFIPTRVLPANQPERGLIYDGLEVATQGICKGLFRIKDTNICTHGPDPAPPGVDIKKSVPPIKQSNRARAATVQCDGDGVSGPRTQVIYAHASDVPDRYNTYLASFQQGVANIDITYQTSAAETGGNRHVRFVHDANCTPTILNVTLSSTGDDNFSNTVDELQALGFNREDRFYLALVDANVLCGVAGLWPDDQPGFGNGSNFGPRWARVDAGCWNYAEAHEHMHMLGAVQLSAPHTSGGYHCVDENDLMCYWDAPNYPPMQYLCPDPSHDGLFDCNHDDYFHTNPSAGSYLATHWNAANNQFLIGGFSSTVPCPTTTDWKGEYWNNTTLSETPTLCRNDVGINFDWQGGSPDGMIRSDNFSARWTRALSFRANS